MNAVQLNAQFESQQRTTNPAILMVTRLSCIHQLLRFWGLFGLGIMMMAWCIRAGYALDDVTPFRVMSLLLGLLLSVITVFQQTPNLWLYVGAVSPQVYLNKEILDRLIDLPD